MNSNVWRRFTICGFWTPHRKSGSIVLSNAAEFNRLDNITLTVSRCIKGSAPGDDWISFCVEHRGTGLGLISTRRFCQMMGDATSVQSTLGQGITFWFRVPLAAISNNPTEFESQTRLKTHKGVSKGDVVEYD